MATSFEQTLVKVWRQVLIENVKIVQLGTERYNVRRTPKLGLRQVDFVFDGEKIRGLEQNPATKSRWARMAREGKKVVQFLSEGRYVANVVEGKVTIYNRGQERAAEFGPKSIVANIRRSRMRYLAQANKLSCMFSVTSARPGTIT